MSFRSITSVLVVTVLNGSSFHSTLEPVQIISDAAAAPLTMVSIDRGYGFLPFESFECKR